MQLLLVLFCLFTGSFSYKFLIYSPLYASSHANFICRVADTISNAGHDVTVILPIVDSLLANKTFIRSHARQIKIAQDPRTEPIMEVNRQVLADLWEKDLDPITMFQVGSNFTGLHQYACEAVISTEGLLEELKAENFDVGISEPISMCGFALFKELGINATIAALSFVQNDFVSVAIDEPLAPSYVPSLMSTDGEKMTFFGRLKNALGTALGPVFFRWVMALEANGLEAALGKKYDFYDLIGSTALVFTNENPFLNYPRPLLHKTIPIGGITMEYDKGNGLGEVLQHINDIYDESQKWDKVLSEREHTVFMSFGTMIKSIYMPKEMKKSILRACAQLPNVTFIWKYEKPDELAEEFEIPPNVYLTTWLPQLAFLADPRLSFMVTHGGLGSITELAYFGKPAMMVPAFGDQIRNCEMLRRHGVGVVLKKSDLFDTAFVVEQMKTMLSTKQFTENAARLGQILRDQPISAQDLVIKHAEFVAKFGSLSKLQPYGRHLSFSQYHLVDVLAFVIAVLVTVAIALFYCMKLITRKWCCRGKYTKIE